MSRADRRRSKHRRPGLGRDEEFFLRMQPHLADARDAQHAGETSPRGELQKLVPRTIDDTERR